MIKTKQKFLPSYKKLPKDLKELKDRVLKLLTLGWCKGAEAEDKFGQPVYYKDPVAVKVCLSGATYRAMSIELWDIYNNPMVDEFFKRLNKILIISGKSKYRVASFNDAKKTTKKDVIKLVKSMEV